MFVVFSPSFGVTVCDLCELFNDNEPRCCRCDIYVVVICGCDNVSPLSGHCVSVTADNKLILDRCVDDRRRRGSHCRFSNNLDL